MSASFYDDQVKRNRAFALSQMQAGSDSSPVKHPLQAAARALQGLVGGYQMGQMDREDKAQQAEANAMMAKLLMGGQAPQTPQAMPLGNAGASPMGAVPGIQNTAQKIYSNDESSPLDPPSGMDRDRAIRTIVAEAGNQGPQGMNAVASVIRNRAVDGGYGGNTPSGVVTAPKQFEPWNDMSGRSRMAGIDPNGQSFQQAAQALDSAYAGNDPTNGAKNFYAPKAQAALGRSAPAWDNGRGVDIGDHRFFGGAQPQQAPMQVAQAGGNTQQIAEMLRSNNPRIVQMGQALAQKQIEAQTKTPEYEYKVRDDGAVVATNKRDPNDIRITKPKGASEDLAGHAAAVEAAKKGGAIKGEAVAQAQVDMPKSIAQRDMTLEQIEKVRAHPGRESFGGAGVSASLGQFRPGSPAYDFKIAVDQLKGGSFLEAYKTLKGGGPIANAEGEKAMAAIARLDRAQTPEAFNEALDDYRNAVQKGFAAMEQTAGVAQPAADQGWKTLPNGIRIREKR